jgi:predicted ribosomally synthesized peptide with SipW-like signal peptide
MKSNTHGLLITFILLVIGALLIGGATVAWFTSSAENTRNSFQSGTLDIKLDREQGNYYFNIQNIAPGDQGSQQVAISNKGSLDLVYQISFTIAGVLAEGENPLEIQLLNSSEERIDTGSERRLASGQQEPLTITWKMPEEAGNEYQGGTARFDLLVNASQVNDQDTSSVMQVFIQAMTASGVTYEEFLSKSNRHDVGAPPYREYYVDSWNGYLEKILEAGDSASNLRITTESPNYGKNSIGYENPFNETDHRGLVVNMQNRGVINYLRNTNPYKTMLPSAIILTRESVFDHGRADDSFILNNLDALKGTVIFYKSDSSTNDHVQVYFIQEDGSKSELVPISDILSD